MSNTATSAQDDSMDEILSSIRRIIADENDNSENKRSFFRRETEKKANNIGYNPKKSSIFAKHSNDDHNLDSDDHTLDALFKEDVLDRKTNKFTVLSEKSDEQQQQEDKYIRKPVEMPLNMEYINDEDERQHNNKINNNFVGEGENNKIKADDLDYNNYINMIKQIQEQNTMSNAEEKSISRSVDLNTVRDDYKDNETSQDGILSHDALRATAEAFKILANNNSSNNNETSSVTVDEMVSELLKPMLKAWLDYNLPTLVEKIVREEISSIRRTG